MSVTYPITRTRTKNGDSFATSKRYSYGTLVETKNYSQPAKYVESVTLGASPSNWRSLISRGQAATSNLTGTRYTIKNPSAQVSTLGTRYFPGYSMTTQGKPYVWKNYGGLPSPDASVADNLAISRLNRSFQKATTSWNGGAFIAEFGETVKMLAHPIKSLYGHTFSFAGNVRGIGRSYVRDPVRYGRLLGGLWLSYAFGVGPLVQDINGAYRAVKALSESLGARDLLPIVGTGQSLGLNMTRVDVDSNFQHTNTSVTVQEKHTVRYHGAVRATPPGVGAIAENFGVGFTDILPSIWEAIPWSWLVDYFVNVNELLASLSLANANLAYLIKGTNNTRTVNTSLFADPSDAGYFDTQVFGGRTHYSSTRVIREAVSTIPYPTWRFQIPGIGSQKWLNLSALAAQIAGSKPRSIKK